jgi:hypothetical protein
MASALSEMSASLMSLASIGARASNHAESFFRSFTVSRIGQTIDLLSDIITELADELGDIRIGFFQAIMEVGSRQYLIAPFAMLL